MKVWRIHVMATAACGERNFFTEAADDAAALSLVKKAENIADDAKVTVTPCQK